jgi:hypothetical protein
MWMQFEQVVKANHTATIGAQSVKFCCINVPQHYRAYSPPKSLLR